MVEHDAVVSALLPWLDEYTATFFDLYSPYPTRTDFWHDTFVEDTWGAEVAEHYEPLTPPLHGQGMAHDVFTSRLAVLDGRRPAAIALELRPDELPPGLAAYLRTFDGGRFVLP